MCPGQTRPRYDALLYPSLSKHAEKPAEIRARLNAVLPLQTSWDCLVFLTSVNAAILELISISLCCFPLERAPVRHP